MSDFVLGHLEKLFILSISSLHPEFYLWNIHYMPVVKLWMRPEFERII